MAKRLYRSRSDAMLAGVCGGLGEYFDLDANLIRLIFVLLSAAGGAGTLAYIALWLIVPVEGETTPADIRQTIHSGAEEMADKARELRRDLSGRATSTPREGGAVFGALLILIGVVFLLRSLGVFWIGFKIIWPSLIILAGIVLFWRRFNSEDNS